MDVIMSNVKTNKVTVKGLDSGEERWLSPKEIKMCFEVFLNLMIYTALYSKDNISKINNKERVEAFKNYLKQVTDNAVENYPNNVDVVIKYNNEV